VASHAGELLEKLPELPTAILTAETRIKSLERNLRVQSRELKRLEEKVARGERGRTMKRLSGSALLVVAAALLFNPLSDALAGPGLSATAGALSALLGSLLLLRA
jgi:hypothetical protein